MAYICVLITHFLSFLCAALCRWVYVISRSSSSSRKAAAAHSFHKMAGGGRRRRAAAAAKLSTQKNASSEMVMMDYGMMGGTSFAHGAGNLSSSVHQQDIRDTKLGVNKFADEEALSPFDPRAWFSEMSRFALFLIFFSVTIFSGKQGQDIFDCE